MSADVTVIAEMARTAELLDADACAFLLGMKSRDGSINRRGFLEQVAVKGSFPKPVLLAGKKRWPRVAVLRWIDDEAKIAAKAA